MTVLGKRKMENRGRKMEDGRGRHSELVSESILYREMLK